jgi:hypothetical protein
MKRTCAIGLMITLCLALPMAASAEVKLRIGDDGELDLGGSLQTLARFSNFRNPNSNDADSGVDLFLHRGLLRLGGYYTDFVRFFLQTEASLATDNDPSVRVSDASLDLHYREIAQLIMGLQRAPANRSILTSDDALMAIDRPGITGYNLTWGLRSRVEFDTTTLRNTNSGIHGPYQDRDLGATLFGAFSTSDMLHFKYYAGIYRGIQNSDDDQDNPRFAGRIQMNLFDPEPGYENLGTYLGTKKTIAIGYSNDTQHDVVTNLKDGKGVAYKAFNQVDLFIEYPLGPGSATFEGAYLHT